jgi:PadR family transcriptional regulator PadR
MTTQTFAVLATMLSEPTAEWYGFNLAERAGIKSGTLYPLLSRLEKAGWLTSHWEDIDPHVAERPRRRLYALTGEGAAAARGELAEHYARLSQAAPFRPEAPPQEQLA